MTIALIPIRSGSKSIPNKNIKEIANKPLVQWVVNSCIRTSKFDKIIITTDYTNLSDIITDVEIFKRDVNNAQDNSKSEDCLIEFCLNYNLDKEDIIVFLQATSPLIEDKHITKGITLLEENVYDSVLSVVRQKRFIWNEDGTPNNYNLNNRPMRQDWNGYLVENGAFYISKVKDILKSKCRVSGNIGMVECNDDTYYEIDEPTDWTIVEKLLEKRYDI